jgi:gamma-glutamyltranspeptidase/glutathione hydrolase
MAPTVGRRRDGSTLAIGSPGADRITTAIAQVLAGYISGGMSLEAAVCHPRVHLHRAGRADEQIRVETDLTMYYGGVGAAITGPGGALDAVADPRRSGVSRIVHC